MASLLVIGVVTGVVFLIALGLFRLVREFIPGIDFPPRVDLPREDDEVYGDMSTIPARLDERR